jgi:hypothetical protein
MSAPEYRYYRFPPPSAYQLNRLLYDVRLNAAVRQRFIADREAVIAEYGLSNAEAAAVRNLGDTPGLTRLGAHPILAFMANHHVELALRERGDQ